MNKELDRVAIGARIKQLRSAKHISQTEFSKILQITQTHLSNLETGKSGLTLNCVIALCNEFDCSADYLIFGDQGSAISVGGNGSQYSEQDIDVAIRVLKAVKDL